MEMLQIKIFMILIHENLISIECYYRAKIKIDSMSMITSHKNELWEEENLDLIYAKGIFFWFKLMKYFSHTHPKSAYKNSYKFYF